MQIRKICKATQQRNKTSKPIYRINIPLVFSDILNITENTKFELTLSDNMEILVKVCYE